MTDIETEKDNLSYDSDDNSTTMPPDNNNHNHNNNNNNNNNCDDDNNVSSIEGRNVIPNSRQAATTKTSRSGGASSNILHLGNNSKKKSSSDLLSTSTTMRKSSSLFLDNSKDIEIIELKLENVYYEPITSTATPTSKTTTTMSTSSSSVIAKAKNALLCCRRNNNKDIMKETKVNTTSNNNNNNNNNNRTTVLSNVTTTVSPFKLTAWMGPSGSGKTSLTSVVAGLIDNNSADDSILRGTIKVNGDVGKLPKQYVGVVWQDDLLLSNLTVEETIYFAARLKTSRIKSDEEVTTLVEETMDELGLLHIRSNLIGSPIANRPGISGGERKRTSVAAELVVKPSVLLCDEPTSGLDATTASSLMLTLKQLANNGHSIATVIHQPRTDIFNMFDHLLLLSKGRVLYDGKPNLVRSYLESCPSNTVDQLPPETGIADWIMDTIIFDEAMTKQKNFNILMIDSDDDDNNKASNDSTKATAANTTTNSVLANYWKSYAAAKNEEKSGLSSSEGISSQQQQQQQLQSSSSSSHQNRLLLNRRYSSLLELKETPKKFESSFRKQFSLLLTRTFKQRRGEKFTSVTVLLTLCYTLFTSLFWWRLPNTTAYVFPRNSIIFFFLIAQGNSIVVSSMTVFQQERALLRRERAKKMYGVLPYFVSKTISDMTNNIVLPLCYGIICYYTVGLRPEFVNFLKFVLGYYLTLSCAQSMGFFLSSVIPNLQMGLILAPPLTLFFFILGGFYIPLADMHVGIKWATYISFARYGYSALLVNEYSGRDIPCADDVDVSISIGDTTTCPVPGDSVYESVGIDGIFASYWFNILMVALLDIFFRTGAYGLLRRSK